MIALTAAGVAIGLTLGAVSMSRAQAGDLIDNKGKAYGYVDFKTGGFHPVLQAKVSSDEITGTSTSGTLDVTITTKIVSTLPKGTSILCHLDVDA